MFASDRDLVAIEPELFRDVAWVGQRLILGVCTIASGSTTVTLTGYDNSFVDADINAGHVAFVDDVAYEVIERLSATTATLSRLRASEDDTVIPPRTVTAKTLSLVSFAPQLRIVHDQILRTLGIEPQDPAEPGAVTEAAITNPTALREVEAYGALHLVFAAAAAMSGPGSPLWVRAEGHRKRFADARRLAAARVDLNGDGSPDATRRMNVLQFMR